MACHPESLRLWHRHQHSRKSCRKPFYLFTPYHNKDLTDGPQGEFLTDRLGDEAARLIRKADSSKPFFLYYATYAVHTPIQAPEEVIEKYRKKQTTPAHSDPVYAALVEVMDRNVGKVLQAISESGQADNTIIISQPTTEAYTISPDNGL